MTDRLYYTDACLRRFGARVTERSHDGRRVTLDRSAFYPTSGGQQHDLGTLAGIAVTDVIDDGDHVTHVLDAPLPADATEVTGVIDWPRRFDRMQQHTGQHLLSAVLEDGWGWRTVSVAMGETRCTLDVAGDTPVTAMALAEAELRANAIVTENRDVTVGFEDAATATGLRKPSERTGELRIVTIADCDRSACGGTHVARTGEIGAILLGASEKVKGGTRIAFDCGQRAVARARHDAELLARMAREVTAGPDELPALLRSARARNTADARTIAALRTELAGHEARRLHAALTPDAAGRRLHRVHQASGPARDAQALAEVLTALGGTIVLVTSDDPATVLLAASDDTGLDCGRTLREALTAAGGRGGGTSRLAQGSAPTAAVIGDAVAALPIW